MSNTYGNEKLILILILGLKGLTTEILSLCTLANNVVSANNTIQLRFDQSSKIMARSRVKVVIFLLHI